MTKQQNANSSGSRPQEPANGHAVSGPRVIQTKTYELSTQLQHRISEALKSGRR